ncbi:MAG TPA: hypothetical protein VJY39_05685 [Acidisphaera sp.]|nr:hypothetical protein [Acidisphaera sp.]
MRHALLPLAAVIGLTFAADPAHALDRRIKLINASSFNIVEFHASNIKRKTFEENILSNRILRPGESIIVNLDDGTDMCEFDFLTVMSNGTKVEKDDVDVCKLETYTIND